MNIVVHRTQFAKPYTAYHGVFSKEPLIREDQWITHSRCFEHTPLHFWPRHGRHLATYLITRDAVSDLRTIAPQFCPASGALPLRINRATRQAAITLIVPRRSRNKLPDGKTCDHSKCPSNLDMLSGIADCWYRPKRYKRNCNGTRTLNVCKIPQVGV